MKKTQRISSGEYDEALAAINESDAFRQSDRLRQLLNYIVAETLAENKEKLLGKNIAIEVFGVDITETEDLSAVRVDVGRLRRRLREYYATEGKSDRIVIDVPKGAYLATFQMKAADGGKKLHSRSYRSRLVFGITAVLATLLMLVGLWVTFPQTGSQSGTPKPFIVVLPLAASENSKMSHSISTGYLEAVIADLSKISGLSVMATQSSKAVADSNIPLKLLRNDQGVTHVVKGTFVTQSESARISVQLIDTDTKAVIFAERFDGKLNNLFELEDALAKRIAAALSVTINPNESQRIYLRHTSNREAIRLVRRAAVSINPPNERGRIEAARSLNLSVIELDPEFPGGYAGLSEVHSYMVLFKHTSQPEYNLEQAVELAQKAIELDGNFGLGHTMLGLAYSLAGKTDLALSHVRRAVALEPGDPLAYQWLSGVLIFSDLPREAVSAMKEGLRLDPIEPGTPYLNILGMAYFNLEQYDEAAAAFEKSLLRGGPNAPNMEAYRAATYVALGRETDARNVIANLNVKSGEITPEAWMRQWPRHFSRSSQSTT